MLLGFRPGHRPTPSGACPVCLTDLRALLPPKSSKPSVYVPKWAAHVVKCVRDAAIAKWEEQERHPETVDRNPLTGRAPAKGKFSSNKLYNGLGDRVGKTCATCVQDPNATEEQKARFGSRAQVVEHLEVFHKILTSTTKAVRVPATAEYFTNLGLYVVDPIGKVEASRALVEERVIMASEGIRAYDVDPPLSIPRGELPEDVAVKAPSDTKYQQVTGPLHSTARDGVCVLCANNQDAPWSERGKPHNATEQALEHHLDGCFRTSIKDHHVLIFRDRDDGDDPTRVPGSADDAEDGPAGVRICPDAVCAANNREFPSARMLANHAVAVHHMRLGMRGKGYAGAKRNSKSHSTTANGVDGEEPLSDRQERRESQGAEDEGGHRAGEGDQGGQG